MEDKFQQECDERVKRIAEHLQDLYNGNDDEVDALEEKLSDLEDAEPNEPDEDDYESEDEYDVAYDRYEEAFNEWERECQELQDKIDELKEEGTLRNYFDDFLDVDYTVNYRKEYESARIWVAIGGPGICVDTRDAMVKLYWGNTRSEYPISYKVRDEIDSIFEEYYEYA